MNLHAPLGIGPSPRHRGRRIVLPIAGAAFVCLVGLGTYFVTTADPRGGEPYAVAEIPPTPVKTDAPAPPLAAATDPTPTGTIPPGRTGEDDVVRIENGVKVVSPSTADRASGREMGPLVIDVSKALDGGARKTVGAAKGSPPGAAPRSTGGAGRPRVAIFVGGLGLGDGNGQITTAIDSLPAAISLAFVPYQGTVATTVAAARAKGHEVLLQLPMQSADGRAPGPHSLRTSQSQAELAGDVAWLMSRFDGYVGVTNLLGAPVTANTKAMTTILRAVASRSVFYLDDGTSRRSQAPSIGKSIGVTIVQADVVLDATNDPAVVDANLERLAAIAKAKGSAIGTANGLSDHLGAIGRFARQLDARGLALVPVGDIARDRTSLATNR